MLTLQGQPRDNVHEVQEKFPVSNTGNKAAGQRVPFIIQPSQKHSLSYVPAYLTGVPQLSVNYT